MVKSVIFLPAEGGSVLYLGSEKIWPLTIQIDQGTVFSEDIVRPREFGNPSIHLETKEIVESIAYSWRFCRPEIGYKKTREFFQDNGFKILQKKNDWSRGTTDPSDKLFFEYPYDWRRDLSDTADQLHQFINTHMLDDDEIYLVGHGMGGLLSREYLRKHAGTHSIKKQILIGTPNLGIPTIYSILKSGKGSFFAKEQDFHMPRNLEVLFQDLPGIYQLLPNERYGQSIVQVDPGPPIEGIKNTYLSLLAIHSFYTLNNDALVNKALDFHNRLDGKSFLDNNTYVIYSTGIKTPTIVHYSNSIQKIQSFTVEPTGDGIVSEKSAFTLEGLITAANKPSQRFTRRFVNILYHQLLCDKRPLRCILQLILE